MIKCLCLTDALDNASTQLQQNLGSLHARQRDLNTKKLQLFCTNLEAKYKLTAEEFTKSIALPLTSAQLKEQLSNYMRDLVASFAKKIGTLVTNEENASYSKSLQQSLAHMADATELQNERALEEVFESAVEVASGVFSSKAVVTEALTGEQFSRITKEGLTAAFQAFDSECKKFSKEKKYVLHEAVLKGQLNNRIKELEKNNERLIRKLMAETEKKLVEAFEERTGPRHLSLPMNDTDLEQRLAAERDNTKREFERTLQNFHAAPGYQQYMEQMLKRLEGVEKDRQAENVEAFRVAVNGPLMRAKQVILLSADKFNTEFSLRTFITDVCLLQLEEGKPKFWQMDLKRSIVKSFMNSDPELRKMIANVSGLWSSIVGFFLWILWLIGW